MLRSALLSLIPLVANAGVTYDLAVRVVDPSTLTLTGQPPTVTVSHYVGEGGKVRIEDASGMHAYVFKDHTMYAIDTAAHTVHVLRHATLAQVIAHYEDAVQQLDKAALHAPPEERAAAEQKAADMRAVSDRLRKTVPRDYRVTVRFESVDGHACRIWEERENGAKRLELCVARPASVPGGAEMLAAMKVLSEFRQGSNFALGVDFGLADWWADTVTFGGVPLLIREYKYDLMISEIMLSNMHERTPDPSVWDAPAGFQAQDGPDYAQWYLH